MKGLNELRHPEDPPIEMMVETFSPNMKMRLPISESAANCKGLQGKGKESVGVALRIWKHPKTCLKQ
jgi:hypothetical protein